MSWKPVPPPPLDQPEAGKVADARPLLTVSA